MLQVPFCHGMTLLMRKICYVTGTRADFGLMSSTLQAIHQHPDLNLGLLVTGMHLLPDYGDTLSEIVASRMPIDAMVPVSLTGGSGAEMSIALGEQLVGFTRALQENRPDILLLLGDRGEMLAGAIAALHLGIHIVHIHGGELSGTVDESIRHAITKLAHYHFSATVGSRERLIRMGEKAENVFVVGAPGLDAIYQTRLLERGPLFSRYKLDPDQSLLLVLFHPVVQQADEAQRQTVALLEAVVETGIQSLVIMPNADAGGAKIAQVIREFSNQMGINIAIHVPRDEYLSLVSHSDAMIGNSSSGIIEAASLNTPVVNVGDRQNCRERNANVIDVPPVKAMMVEAINRARQMNGQCWENVYGDGTASSRIVEHLLELSLAREVLEKVNAY